VGRSRSKNFENFERALVRIAAEVPQKTSVLVNAAARVAAWSVESGNGCGDIVLHAKNVDISDDAWTAMLLINAAMVASRIRLGVFVVGVGKQHLRCGHAVGLQPRREARHLRATPNTTARLYCNRTSCRIQPSIPLYLSA
jgi:hypothetical protein